MEATNLREFSKSLDEAYEVEVKGYVEALVRRVAFAVDKALVMGTPVGNPDIWKANTTPRRKSRSDPGYVGKGYVGGRARANWIPTLGTPASGVSARVDKQGASTVALLAGVTANYKLEDGPIWIVNNSPYISRLNDGHSKQAPAGFVEAAIDAGIREALR
jgi:hypothetical protein